jgi:hypothetical protein
MFLILVSSLLLQVTQQRTSNQYFFLGYDILKELGKKPVPIRLSGQTFLVHLQNDTTVGFQSIIGGKVQPPTFMKASAEITKHRIRYKDPKGMWKVKTVFAHTVDLRK